MKTKMYSLFIILILFYSHAFAAFFIVFKGESPALNHTLRFYVIDPENPNKLIRKDFPLEFAPYNPDDRTYTITDGILEGLGNPIGFDIIQVFPIGPEIGIGTVALRGSQYFNPIGFDNNYVTVTHSPTSLTDTYEAYSCKRGCSS